MELSLKEAELEEHWKQEAAWGECGNMSNASCFGTKKQRWGGVRNYPLITKELLTDEVNLYLLIRKHIQDALAEQYV